MTGWIVNIPNSESRDTNSGISSSYSDKIAGSHLSVLSPAMRGTIICFKEPTPTIGLVSEIMLVSSERQGGGAMNLIQGFLLLNPSPD